jgi:hypothetical protein
MAVSSVVQEIKLMCTNDNSAAAQPPDAQAAPNAAAAAIEAAQTAEELLDAVKAANDPVALARLARIFHEAAHVLVAHKLGGTVSKVTDWHGSYKLTKLFATLNASVKNHQITSDEGRDALHAIVACFAAGYLIEKEVVPQVEAISQRIKPDMWAMLLPEEKADRDFIIWVMRESGVTDMEFVEEAEASANKFVTDNRKLFDALVLRLYKNAAALEGNELEQLLKQ